MDAPISYPNLLARLQYIGVILFVSVSLILVVLLEIHLPCHSASASLDFKYRMHQMIQIAGVEIYACLIISYASFVLFFVVVTIMILIFAPPYLFLIQHYPLTNPNLY